MLTTNQRKAVAGVSVFAGFLAAGVYLALTGQANAQRKGLLIIHFWVIVLAVAYSTGGLLYRWLDAAEEVEEIESASTCYLPVLHLTAGLFILCSPWLQPGNDQIADWFAFCIGATSIGLAVYTMYHNSGRGSADEWDPTQQY